MRKLSTDELYHRCDTTQLGFTSSDQVAQLDQPLGQQRALRAIEFGVDIERDGFNLFVLGAAGLGKHELVKQILARKTQNSPPGSDWCYVNNFAHPQKPLVLQLPPGVGLKLQKDMETLVEDLLTSLPSAFESEEYRNRLQEIEEELHERQEQAFKSLDEEAKARGIAVIRTPGGYTLGPKINGKLLNAEEYKALPQAEKDRIEKIIADLQLELQSIIRDLPLLQREHHQRIKQLNEGITEHTVEKLLAWVENSYSEIPQVVDYLAAVKKNAIENVEAFLPDEGARTPGTIRSQVEEFHEYRINVIVDNSSNQQAAVIFEDNPSYQNLIGRVEYVSQLGALLTDFTLIKPGTLHRANGGYLVLDAQKLLTHALAWEGLKRALKSKEIKIESLEEMLSLANTVSLEPQTIPLKLKVILTGEPLLYYLLKEYDPEFGKIFKVAADFSQSTDRSEQNIQLYARLIASIQQQESTRPLSQQSVARLIEHASRLAQDSEKLSLHVDSMRDLILEADYHTGRSQQNVIDAEHIEQAITDSRARHDKYHEQAREQIMRGIKLIDTDGEIVAQVNGLSVAQVGDYSFGQPARITATARLGRSGVIDIEREAKLGGHIHSKGVMILSSYLASHYAANRPLPLAASLVFEQSYGTVDGDSASAAELCALLSALGNIPLKQSIAVTGSMNQHGEIQPIGGVNEKIEGFFEICTARGLNGEHAVIIPQANRVHLMLNQQVRDAVREGKFSVYTASSVEDVMALLSGLTPGQANTQGEYPPGTFNYRVQQRVKTLLELQQKYLSHEPEAEADIPPAG